MQFQILSFTEFRIIDNTDYSDYTNLQTACLILIFIVNARIFYVIKQNFIMVYLALLSYVITITF